MKNVRITADDFGIDESVNEAIFEASKAGMLTDTCIMANGGAFWDAVLKAKEMKINIGVHLNIIEGKSLIAKGRTPLTDENGHYDRSFFQMLLASFDRDFLKCVEAEFSSQIETVLEAGIKPAWLNSHVHTHAIPNIFEITCRLAQKYGIKNIRTQAERPYWVGKTKPINLVKNLVLNLFTLQNKRTLKKYGLATNDAFIGVLYTGHMTKNTILKGLEKLNSGTTVEIILHPTTNKEKYDNYTEYLTLLN